MTSFSSRGYRRHPRRRTLKWAVLPIAVFVVLGLIYTDFSVERAVYEAGVRPFSPMERLLTQGRVLFFYVSLLLYPIPSRLTLLHDIDISRTLFDPWTTLAAIVGIVLCLLFAALKARKYPLLSFAILFFILNHLVEGTRDPPGAHLRAPQLHSLDVLLRADSVRDGPLPGLFLLSAGVFRFSWPQASLCCWPSRGTRPSSETTVVRSDVHLWLDNVRKAPGLSRPRINLAKHYYEAGMYEEAVRELKTAEELNRDTNLRQIGLASYNLGIYYLDQAKDVDRAEQQFIKALERFPGHPSAIVGLATVHLKRGEIEKAWTLMQENAPRHRNDVEMINCLRTRPAEKRKPAGRHQGGGTVHRTEMERPSALGDIGRGLAEARAVAKSSPVLGGGAAHEPGKPESAAGPRGTLRPVEGRPGPCPHGGAMHGAQGRKAPG